jgi:2-oxoglutarate/2-oxoacid ferredoxin oxidoreductase subunit beta
MATMIDLQTPHLPTWCPGCGDYGILAALKMALVSENIDMNNAVIVYGIGCSGNMANLIKAYGFHGLHGRAVPVAEGVKMANKDLHVFVTGGDGDGYGIGLSHFVHAARRNFNITYLVHDNQIYGLTTGQFSPTTEEGVITKTSPAGNIDTPVNPITLAISTGATFVARGFAGDGINLVNIIRAAINHKGFSLVDIAQPCVTFNHHNTYDWFKERLYPLESVNHDSHDKVQAFTRALEWGEKVPWGIFYQEDRAIYEDQLEGMRGVPLVNEDITNVNIASLIEDFSI